MKAVLLAAGFGTRLRPLTDAAPKILVPLGGRTLLEHQLAYLGRAGIDEVVVNVHHHAEQVRRFLARVQAPVRVRLSDERRLLGTAGALVPLRDFLGDRFLVLYGDVVTDADVAKLVAAHEASGAVASLGYVPSEQTDGKGVLTIDSAGTVSGFVEKPSRSGGGLVNAGLYVLERSVLELIPDGASDFGRDVWPRALALGVPIHGHELRAYVRDIGTPEALAAAERDLAAGRIRW